jgi:hypothetical protein
MSSRWKWPISAVASASAATLLTVVVPALTSAATTPLTAAAQWQRLAAGTLPATTSDSTYTGRATTLSALTQISPTNAWAVGTYYPRAGSSQTVILHWNGKAWSRVTSPNPASRAGLTSVSARSATDVWAVGSDAVGTLVLHWKGAAWETVKSPNPGKFSGLASVSAVSTNDAWAVGNDTSGPFILNWNGRTWAPVAASFPGTIKDLNGVSAVSGKDAWAVGEYYPGSTGYRTLVMHWNGKAWSKVGSPDPSPSGGGTFLYGGVSAVSATNAWAMGFYYNKAGSAAMAALILHWNGHSWSRSRPPSGPDNLTQVSAQPASAWAVGQTSAGVGQVLQLHGTTWSAAKAPSAGVTYTPSAIHDSGAGAWLTGSYCASACGTPFAVYDSLIMHWNGSRWSKT